MRPWSLNFVILSSAARSHICEAISVGWVIDISIHVWKRVALLKLGVRALPLVLLLSIVVDI